MDAIRDADEVVIDVCDWDGNTCVCDGVAACDGATACVCICVCVGACVCACVCPFPCCVIATVVPCFCPPVDVFCDKANF